MQNILNSYYLQSNKSKSNFLKLICYYLNQQFIGDIEHNTV